MLNYFICHTNSFYQTSNSMKRTKLQDCGFFAECNTITSKTCLLCRVCLLHKSSLSHESSSRQVPFLLFSFSFCFVFVLIKGCDRDSCFHNDVPTDVQSIYKHERDIIVYKIVRELSVANYQQPSFILPTYNFPESVCPMSLVTTASVTMPCETHLLEK